MINLSKPGRDILNISPKFTPFWKIIATILLFSSSLWLYGVNAVTASAMAFLNNVIANTATNIATQLIFFHNSGGEALMQF